MDPTPERDGAAHPELDTLAELDEGLPAAAGAAEHVAGCDRCRGELARLRATREALGALPPLAMPADVAARLHAALADADGAAGTTVPAPGAAAATVLADRRRDRADRWRGRLPGLAAAASLAAVAGAIGWAAVGHGSSSGGGDAASGAAADSSARRAATGPVLNHTGARYTVDSLRAAVPALLSGTAGAEATGGAKAGHGAQPPHASSGGLGPVVNGPAAQRLLDDCARNLGADPARLLASDDAFFGGRQVVVLVFPVPDEPQRVQIFLAGPDCATNPSPIPQIVIANR